MKKVWEYRIIRKNYLEDGDSMTIKDIVKNVAEVKNHIIDETYIAVVIMSGPSIIASLLFFSDNELISVTFQIVLIMFLLLFIHLHINI